jgi:DNA-damage-inducible protein D
MDITYVRDALEKARKSAPNGQNYWSAREMMPILGYETWRRFMDALDRAEQACTESGYLVSHHFVESGKMVDIGSGATRQIEDIILSRYACYLVTMNGDPAKPEIATAQAYFAIQTRLQELQQELPEIERRKLLRERVIQANKGLSSAAKEAGVRSAMFGIFHDEGYKGLYGGLGVAAIKKKKKIDAKEDLLDHAGRVELAANEFRITQAEERIRNQRV